MSDIHHDKDCTGRYCYALSGESLPCVCNLEQRLRDRIKELEDAIREHRENNRELYLVDYVLYEVGAR
jgi:hypothetical protein